LTNFLPGLSWPVCWLTPASYERASLASWELAGWLVERHGARGRVAVDSAAVAGLLAITSSLPVLGPLASRGSPSATADPAVLPVRDGRVRDDALAAYVERYAVGTFVLSGPPGPFDGEHSLLDPPLDVAGFRVRRVRREPGYFAEGGGRVVEGRPGTLRVEGAAGSRIVLRFHFDERLACRPRCRVERVVAPGVPAGFVGVPDPPEAFEVYAR
jgi:hypothetical protein